MDTPAPRELMIERDLWVTARDGVRLATDVYRPTSGGPVSGPDRAHRV
jgi:predicted acyl esterase